MAHGVIGTLQILNRNRLGETFGRGMMKTLLLVRLHLRFDRYLLTGHLKFPRHFSRMLAKHNWVRLNPRMMANPNVIAVLR
jgi:hypothetical protein